MTVEQIKKTALYLLCQRLTQEAYYWVNEDLIYSDGMKRAAKETINYLDFKIDESGDLRISFTIRADDVVPRDWASIVTSALKGE